MTAAFMLRTPAQCREYYVVCRCEVGGVHHHDHLAWHEALSRAWAHGIGQIARMTSPSIEHHQAV